MLKTLAELGIGRTWRSIHIRTRPGGLIDSRGHLNDGTLAVLEEKQAPFKRRPVWDIVAFGHDGGRIGRIRSAWRRGELIHTRLMADSQIRLGIHGPFRDASRIGGETRQRQASSLTRWTPAPTSDEALWEVGVGFCRGCRPGVVKTGDKALSGHRSPRQGEFKAQTYVSIR